MQVSSPWILHQVSPKGTGTILGETVNNFSRTQSSMLVQPGALCRTRGSPNTMAKEPDSVLEDLKQLHIQRKNRDTVGCSAGG